MAEENEPNDGEETIGTGNPRDEYRRAIADQIDDELEKSGELSDVDDDTPARAREVVEESPQPDQPSKRTLKVNGVERQVTEEELIALAQKGYSADERFAEAAALRNEAAAFAQKQRLAPDPDPVSTVDDDDRALARALQMGNEDEAAAVIAKLRRTPSVNDEVVRAIDERLTFKQASDRVLSEFKDITSDPYLWQLMQSEDEKLVKSGDSRGYWERYQDIGGKLRQHFRLPAPHANPGTDEKLARKASVTPLPKASVRNSPQAEDDGPENPSDVIRAQAKARGQII